MGASDSKIVFKRGIFRLSEERNIPADDQYWTSFWELPESSEDVFSLFSPNDIRRTRDQALENIETLILAVTSRLFILRNHPSFPDEELAPERDALNCIRVLTRLLPFLYEKDTLESWDDRFFWGARRKKTRKAAIVNEVLFDEASLEKRPQQDTTDEYEEAKPLAEELIDTLKDLLFYSDFTLPKQPHGQPKVSYAIWQSGVGCKKAMATTKEFESNRCEILRLLLTLAGQSMYLTPAALPQRGVRSLTYLCTNEDKQVVLSVLCSLLNTTLKFQPTSWRVPYNSLVMKDTKQLLVTHSVQLLLTMLLYPIPETQEKGSQKNYYRYYLGRLFRPDQFQFIVDGTSRILSQPMQEKSSYLPGSQSSTNLAPEVLMLFWETIQCNKRFRCFLIDTERFHDFVVLALFYASEYKNDQSKQGIVRMCVFLLQTLSVEQNFGPLLNKRFEGQESLPTCMRINGFSGTYTDFLLHSIYNLITTSQGNLASIYPALLAVISNIAPSMEKLSAASSQRLMHLLGRMSSPSFLLANDTNHNLLGSLLDSINTIVEHKYKQNMYLIATILKNRKRIENLRNFTLEAGLEEMQRSIRRRKETGSNTETAGGASARTSIESTRSAKSPQIAQQSVDDDTFAIGDDDDSDEEPQPTPAPSSTGDDVSRASSVVAAEDDLPTQLPAMSEKARGKMPAVSRAFSRQNSTSSMGSFSAAAQSQGGHFEPTSQWIDSWLPELPLHTLLTIIQQLSAVLPRQTQQLRDLPALDVARKIQHVDIVGIEPSPIKLQSFEWNQLSLGWYESLLWGIIFASEMQISRGALGIWSGTAVKLFRVQEAAPSAPSLTSPRGAVDAVGSNIVSRIGQINIRGAQAPAPEPPSSPRSGS